MQLNTLKLNNKRKKKKTIGRGGKKGTYSGKGMKGQKARSGAHVNPLFEGGRSTLIDHMKKKRGFKAVNDKRIVLKLSDLDKHFKDGETINIESLISKGLIDKIEARRGFKIVATGELKKKLIVEDKKIMISAASLKALEKTGGKRAS